MDTIDPIRILRQSSLFGDLLEEDYALLEPGTRIRTFEPGEFLFYEGARGGSAFLIVEGSVSIERTTDSAKGDSETVPIAVRGRDEVVGELSLFDEAPRNADARAITRTTTLQIRGRHVRHCAEQSPELALGIIRGLVRKLREATDRRTQARVENVRGRLLRVLEEEARLHGVPEEGGVRILLATPERRLTQSDLGARAGCDRAVVNRTLAELDEEGVIEKSRTSILLHRGASGAGTNSSLPTG